MDPINVLLVDDEPEIGTFMKLKLSREAPDFAFAFVESGQGCLEYIRDNKVDCILSDYQMPSMDGMELLIEVRRQARDLPFIFLTGQGNEEVAREAFKNGANDYFTKDIGFAHFARIINSIEQAVKGRAAEVERRRADEALRASEQRLLLHVQQTPLGVIEWDVDFRVVSWNPSAEKIFGYSAEEARGRHASFIVSESVRSHVNGVWEELLARKGGERSTNMNVTRDGRAIMCEWYNTPLVAGDGGVMGVASFVQDVTERQKAERALAESEEKFRNLVEKSLVGVYLIQDENSRYVFKYVNSMMAGILGYSVDELIGMDVLETGLPEDMPLVKENLRRRIAGEIDSISYGFKCMKKNGEIIDVMVYGTRTMYMGKPAVIGTLLDITERKIAETALLESEEKFRRLVDQAADAFILHDSEGRIVDVNQQACDSLGYTREELLRMSVKDIEMAFESENVPDLWRIITPDSPITIDGVHRRKDGTTFPVEVRVGILNVAGEQLMLALARDVTERVKAEDALKASQKFLETIIETEPECVKLITPDGKLQLMNRAGLKMIQAESLDQVKDSPISGLIAREHRKAFREVGEKVFRGEEAQLVFDMIGFKGRRLTLETHAVPLRNEKDEIIGLLGVTRDITEKRRADEALKKSEERLRSIMETTEEWIWEIDGAGVHTYSNEAIESILGYGTEDIIGKNALELMHEGDRAGVEKMLPRLVAEKKGWRGLVLRWQHKDGSYRYMESNALPIIDDTGEVAGFRGTDRDITDRKRAEDALRESEAKFRALVEDANVGVIIIQDGRIVYRNPWQEAVLGYGPGEKPGQNEFLKFVHPDDHETVAEAVRSILDGKRGPRTFEFRIMRKDGGIVYLESHGCLTDYNGRPAVIGFSMDITARKLVEDALHESEARFRALTESTSDWIWETDARGTYTYSSPKVEDILGYAPAELIGKRAFDLMPPEEAGRVEAEFGRLVASRLPIERLENVNITKDGRRVVMETNGIPVIGKDGEFVGYRGIDRDITERKKAEETLLSSNLLLSIQQESSLDGILAVNEKREVISYNTRFTEIWGIPSDVMEKRSGHLVLQSVLHNLTDPDEFVERINYLYAHPTEKSVDEVQLKDGRTFDRYSAPMITSEGRYFGRVWYYRDVTEKKRQERHRKDFYAMVTHDLKSPLMALTGFVDLLGSRPENLDENARTVVASMRRSCGKLIAIIENLLSVSRLESENFRISKSPVDVEKMLEEACAGFEGDITKKGLRFRFELADGLPGRLYMDRNYVQRAVSNLLQNAVNYTPSGGEVTLRAETLEEGGRTFAVISVADNGPGIPAAEHSRIFDKYYRVPGTFGVKGTGLGLAIVKAVADAHGGRVELESEPGKGSTFRLVLPVNSDLA